jgi:hypothetical protein
MSEEARLRELMCLLAKSLFDRGLTGGSQMICVWQGLRK